MEISEEENLEINFWKNSQYESPNNFSIQAIIYKLAEAKIFLKKIDNYKIYSKIPKQFLN